MPFLLFFVVVFSFACSSVNAPPEWISEPGLGVVGQARMNIKGRAQQIAVATARARDELAARQGVIISSKQVLSEKIRNNRSSTSLDRHSEQDVVNKEVKASVIDVWCHPKSAECWVWLMPN